MDITEIRKKREQLQHSILELVRSFEQETETAVTQIDSRHVSRYGRPESLAPLSQVIDVNIRVDLDA